MCGNILGHSKVRKWNTGNMFSLLNSLVAWTWLQSTLGLCCMLLKFCATFNTALILTAAKTKHLKFNGNTMVHRKFK